MTTGMVFLGRADDKVDHGGETSTAAASLGHCVIDFRGDDKLPTIFIKELVNDVLDFLVGDVIAAANQHNPICPGNMILNVSFFAK